RSARVFMLRSPVHPPDRTERRYIRSSSRSQTIRALPQGRGRREPGAGLAQGGYRRQRAAMNAERFCPPRSAGDKLARMLVQIYEIGDPEEARAAAAAGVDHIGVLVGGGEFPRERSAAEARAIFAALPKAVKRVALSLSADPGAIARAIAETAPDIVHI